MHKKIVIKKNKLNLKIIIQLWQIFKNILYKTNNKNPNN